MSEVIKCDICGKIVDVDQDPGSLNYTLTVSGVDENGSLARIETKAGDAVSRVDCCSRACVSKAVGW